MTTPGHDSGGRLRFCSLACAIAIAFCNNACGEQLFQLRNNMVLRGIKVELVSLKDGFGAANSGEVQNRPIWMIDDGLRRIYINKLAMSTGEGIDVNDIQVTMEFFQPEPLKGKAVSAVGQILRISPFNDFGHRHLEMRGPDGVPMVLLQGITEINNRFAKVNALKAIEGNPSIEWDMRIATRSLDSETLRRIFYRRIPADDRDGRIEVVRFFKDAERYNDAHEVLEEIIRDFPDAAELQSQLIALIELQATQLLDEAQRRVKAGQEPLARAILESFPQDKVGRVTRLKVADELEKLNTTRDRASELAQQLKGQVDQLSPEQKTKLQPIVDEITAGLSTMTLPRLSDYARLGNSEAVPLDNRVALGIAGWLLGAGAGEQNLTIVTALVQVRALVSEYLADSDPNRRKVILDELRNLEGAEPEYVARMLPLLVPPLGWPEDAVNESVEGMFDVSKDGVSYSIQLPPNYDPLREYPCIVALHETGWNVDATIDWWAGRYDAPTRRRTGHATRNGFIVVAPIWSRSQQRLYEYTPPEHERVLAALRHAMRRCSIDADRVFIAGHGEGATAAWDIAISHPDLWAGLVALSPRPDKTIRHYSANAEHLPMYFVVGDKDGSMARSGAIFEDYINATNNAMLVKYRGRGREYFYDEIPAIMEWLQLPTHRRVEPPQDIETVTMRSGDQFFWWLELSDLSPNIAINPILWDDAKRIRAANISATIGNNNSLRISAGPSERFTIWLRPIPDAIDMANSISVAYRSRRSTVAYDGSLEVMLEDTRRRADRKRPFWASVTLP